ncbi:hypothetical protein [Micromonospora aurantiaca (nom. illeg.)]|uniref:hypothetical protein n=1 Tax=Micromonospora aurantiaca (nom. illeg.) TaxID=47850 RepID=UPI003F49EAA0
MNTWVAIATVVGAIVGSAGVTKIIEAVLRRLRRRGTAVERVKTLTDSTLEWAEDLRAEAAAARREANAARSEAAQARRELATLRADIGYLETRVSQIVQLIHHEPGMTLDRLRQLVPDRAPTRPQEG